MTGDERERRDSRALEPELVTDLQEKAAAEARNGFRQYDAAIGAIHTALDRGKFKLRPSLILGLQREALTGISSMPGTIVRVVLPSKGANMSRSGPIWFRN
jgi:hypothetical protein